MTQGDNVLARCCSGDVSKRSREAEGLEHSHFGLVLLM